MPEHQHVPRTRREVLGLFGGLGVTLLLASCADGSSTAGGTRTTRGGTTASGASGSSADAPTGVEAIPEETAGPYPGDGSNGPDVLNQDGVVRSDIRSSFGGASAVAAGVPLTLDLTLTDVGDRGRALPGAAVYVWHCDRAGRYSFYSPGLTDENYLRGVQVADADGAVTFTTVFPGAYPGRWPHIHLEVYRDLASARTATNLLRTSQLAMPADACTQVYATDGYASSASTFRGTTLQSDNVFSDGWSLQVPTVTGDPAGGYTARLPVGI
jgi:protocatechuate 3,4-dioxygenase beta subunit